MSGWWCAHPYMSTTPLDSRATKGGSEHAEAGSEYELEALQLVVDEQSHEISLALWPS